MLRVLIINILVSLPLILAQQPKSCPNVRGLQRDLYNEVGLWYVYSTSANVFDESLECTRVTCNPPNGSNFSMIFESISTITNQVSSIVVTGQAGSPTLRHHVPVLGEVSFDSYLLGADYDRWAIFWHCDSEGKTPIEKSIIFTRQKFPDVKRLNQFIDQSYRRWGLQKPQFRLKLQDCQL